MKKKKRLIWQLYSSYLLIILLSLIAVSGYASRSFRHFFTDRALTDLKIQSRIMEKQISRFLSPLDTAALNHACKALGTAASAHITFILPNGRVVADSENSPETAGNNINLPEVKQALSGEIGTAIRYSRQGLQHKMFTDVPLEQKRMFVALALKKAGQLKGVLRTSIPLTFIDKDMKAIHIRIAVGGFFIALFASGICLYISRRISRPIEEMKQVADHFAKGDLSHRLATPNTKEMADLARIMSQMAARLEERIETVIKQRNEYEAVLSSMVEGVVAVDMEEYILSMNQAAVKMFRSGSSELKGRSIQEVVRNRELHGFVRETLCSGDPAGGDILLHHNGERILNTHCTPLRDSKERCIGALLVFHDVTQLRKLENMRQDFVANVSHEIRTPLTAIKGFVETLNQGAIDDPEDAARFLGIIERHVNRLAAIIDDLLLLSRIDREDEISLELEEKSLGNVIHAAIQICQPNAEEKNIRLDLTGDMSLSANVDPPLLEQAVVNLIDNAVKYSKEGSAVLIETARSDSEVIISVQDCGIGISKHHLPRLFERFYRVDKARSRKLGGTGLGLAIVKHIVQAHGGRVMVESTLGKGSLFAIHLPLEINLTEP